MATPPKHSKPARLPFFLLLFEPNCDRSEPKQTIKSSNFQFSAKDLYRIARAAQIATLKILYDGTYSDLTPATALLW